MKTGVLALLAVSWVLVGNHFPFFAVFKHSWLNVLQSHILLGGLDADTGVSLPAAAGSPRRGAKAEFSSRRLKAHSKSSFVADQGRCRDRCDRRGGQGQIAATGCGSAQVDAISLTPNERRSPLPA